MPYLLWVLRPGAWFVLGRLSHFAIGVPRFDQRKMSSPDTLLARASPQTPVYWKVVSV